MEEIEALTSNRHPHQRGASWRPAALLCLQEVEEAYLEATLRPALLAAGWERVLFACRGKDNFGVEGVALCWRGGSSQMSTEEGNGQEMQVSIALLHDEIVDLDQCVLDAATASAAGIGEQSSKQQMPPLQFCEQSMPSATAKKKLLPKPTGCVALLARLRVTVRVRVDIIGRARINI